MSRRKSRIGAGIPAPNDDVTMPIGAKMLTEAGQMHVPGCDPGTCPDLVPGPVLHVHGQVLYPELRSMTAETMVSELSSFSLTVHTRRNGVKTRIFSNFGRVIRALYGRKPSAEVPKAPSQVVLDRFG